MAVIAIENMEFFAYHGCFEEEQLIGNKFIVDISFSTPTEAAEISDRLSDTVNYQRVYQIIAAEMETRSALLEHLARRIMDAVTNEFPGIENISLKVAKLHPPLGGKVESVSVKLQSPR